MPRNMLREAHFGAFRSAVSCLAQSCQGDTDFPADIVSDHGELDFLIDARAFEQMHEVVARADRLAIHGDDPIADDESP